MKILALEFSTSQRSVAVASRDAEGEPRILAEVVETDVNSRGPLGMIEQALSQAGVGREEIKVIVVGLGPGSYTGIRMSIALAQGWQLARPLELKGVTSADAMAHRAWQNGLRDQVTVAIDAQRGDYYVGEYAISEDGFKSTEALSIVPRAALTERILAGAKVLIPEAQPLAGSVSLFPTAKDLAALITGKHGVSVTSTLEPVYFRPISFVKAPPLSPLVSTP